MTLPLPVHAAGILISLFILVWQESKGYFTGLVSTTRHYKAGSSTEERIPQVSFCSLGLLDPRTEEPACSWAVVCPFLLTPLRPFQLLRHHLSEFSGRRIPWHDLRQKLPICIHSSQRLSKEDQGYCNWSEQVQDQHYL